MTFNPGCRVCGAVVNVRTVTGQARQWITVSMLAGLAWMTPHIAQACSCSGRHVPQEAARQSDAVFEGRVIAAPSLRSGYSETVTYEFSVTRQWKGDVGQRVRIKTPASSAACGRRYYSGEVYLIYATRGADDVLFDSICTRTRESRRASEDFAALGPSQEPVKTQKVLATEAVEPPRIPAPRPDFSGLSSDGKGCHIGGSQAPGGWLVVLLACVPWLRTRRARSM